MSIINWTDQVTPLNAANMSQLEQTVRKNAASGYLGLDASSNVAFAAAQRITWAADTNLYRQAAGVLQSDTDIEVRGGSAFRVRLGYVATPNAGGLMFGTTYDVNLYRSAADTLKTDDSFISAPAANVLGFSYNPAAGGTSGTALQSIIGAQANPMFYIRADGYLNWGPGSGTPTDTSISRNIAGWVRVQDNINLPTNIDHGISFVDTTYGYGGIRRRAAVGYAEILAQNAVVLAPATGNKVYITDSSAGTIGTLDTTLYRAAAAVLKTDGAIATAAYGTSLPASPVDGQEFTLVDSITNPTYQWRFRYNAGSSSAYKWEFVGGPPLRVEIAASEPISFTTGAWVNCTTPGPDIVVPRSGDYIADARVLLSATTSTVAAFIGVANASVGTTPVGIQTAAAPISGGYASLSANPFIPGVTAGQTLRVQYASGAAHNFSSRSLAVLPRRVS
jgi:hypothetical protein